MADLNPASFQLLFERLVNLAEKRHDEFTHDFARRIRKAYKNFLLKSDAALGIDSEERRKAGKKEIKIGVRIVALYTGENPIEESEFGNWPPDDWNKPACTNIND